MNRIGTGASLDMVNDEFGTEITPEDFMNMRSSTGFGNTMWERSLTGANMLMQTQDPTEIQKIFGEY